MELFIGSLLNVSCTIPHDNNPPAMGLSTTAGRYFASGLVSRA
jgi:hypothetical protein